MVAGDEVGGRLELRQRCRRGAQVLHAAVHQVADDRDDVRLGGVDRVDDLLGEAPAEDRARVDVADHGDAVTVCRARELGERHGDALHTRAAQDAVRAVADRSHGGCGGGSRYDAGDEEAAGRLRERCGPGVGLRRLRRYGSGGYRLRYGRRDARPPCRQAAQQGPYDLSRHDGQQQIDRQRQPQEARPGQDLLEPEGRAGALAHDGADRQHPATRDPHRTRAAREARAPGGVAEQTAPQVPVGRAENAEPSSASTPKTTTIMP